MSFTKQDVQIIYPLEIKYEDDESCEKNIENGGAIVFLKGLIPDYLKREHLDKKNDRNKIIMKMITLEIPTTYNLYIAILCENEHENVKFVEKQLKQFIVNFLNRKKIDEPYNKINRKYNVQLDLVLTDMFVSMTSLYDCANNVENFFLYEKEMENKVTTIMAKTNLYRCQLNEYKIFHEVYNFLQINSYDWKNVFRVPVNQDNEISRFTFDTFLKNIKLEKEAKINIEKEKIFQLMGGTKYNEDLFEKTQLKGLFKSYKKNEKPSNETIFRNFKTYKRKITNKELKMNVEKKTEKNCDIYKTFSMGEWCIYRKTDNFIHKINKNEFKKFFTSFNELQAKEEQEDIINKVFETPLSFLPKLIWDIETIAEKPCTIPRGISIDEKVVSIAISAEYENLNNREQINIVWVLTPDSISAEERKSIANLNVEKTNIEGENLIKNTIIKCFTDEQKLLYDFLISMITRTPILNKLYGINLKNIPIYHNIAYFLVGHNSICYDFLFLVNRCIFFGFNELTKHLQRNIHTKNGKNICFSYTFANGDICLDTMLFLMTRAKNLSSFDLSSVLKAYNCEIQKGTLNARLIRFFYNSLNEGKEEAIKYGYENKEKRLEYFREFIMYNILDCISLGDLLKKMSYPIFVCTMMNFFHISFDVACYQGNSNILPNLFIGELYAENREILIHRPISQVSIMTMDLRIWDLKNLNKEIEENLEIINKMCGKKYKLTLCLEEYTNEFLEDENEIERTGNKRKNTNEENNNSKNGQETKKNGVKKIKHQNGTSIMNLTFLPYNRLLNGSITINTEDIEQTRINENKIVKKNLIKEMENSTNINEEKISFLCEAELELLRVTDKTYVGGLNYANPCHAKNPICMDYNSFYPSIIRHYNLDTNNVAVFSILRLITLIRPMKLLEQLIEKKILRIFDYTTKEDIKQMVNTEVFEDPKFSDIFKPVKYAKREWYEGIELTNLKLLIISSKSMRRKVLVLLKKGKVSTVSKIVTGALERRQIWKKLRKENPNDKVLETRELMEKLIANSTYGYLNYSKSVIFSRATAAAVTLLCRNAFARTRYIIESKEILQNYNLDAERFFAIVNYIDTDGCIVTVHKHEENLNDRKNNSIFIKNSNNQKICQLEKPTFLKNTLTETNTPLEIDNLDFFLKKNIEKKGTFVDLVNNMLNMKHVKLAAEHENAISVTIFGRKKYILFKIEENGLFSLKKVGFEKNAAKPIKELYEILLQNVCRLNNTMGIIRNDKFIKKIVRHDIILFCIFDYLYESWQMAIRSEMEKKNKNFKSEKISLEDFSKNIPLNPKNTKGKLAEFIDKTISEHQYNAGERVKTLKVIPIGSDEYIREKKPIVDAVGNCTILYDTNDFNYVLLDEIIEEPEKYIPDLKNFLGGHLTYMYQCIEGCQTLRETEAIEPICWINDSVLGKYINDLINAHEKFRKTQKLGDGKIYWKNRDYKKNCLFLRNLKNICSLFYSIWLWERILKNRHNKIHGEKKRYALIWKETQSVDSVFVKILSRKCMNVNIDDETIRKELFPIQTPANFPPHLITIDFIEQWFQDKNTFSIDIELTSEILFTKIIDSKDKFIDIIKEKRANKKDEENVYNGSLETTSNNEDITEIRKNREISLREEFIDKNFFIYKFL